MIKIVQVYMLPTDKRAADTKEYTLHFNSKGKLLYYPGAVSETKVQHLYFTSEEEIKEGDWFYDFLYKVKQFKDKYKPAQYSRKIVATTNPELWSKLGSKDTDGYTWMKIAAIPLSFVKEYVEKQVKEVKLEYNTCPIDANGNVIGTGMSYPYKDLLANFTIKYSLKLDSQGCIIISPIEETWTEIFANWQRSQGYSKTIDGLQHYLDMKYNSPIKK